MMMTTPQPPYPAMQDAAVYAALPRLPMGDGLYPWVGEMYPDQAPYFPQRPLSDLTHIVVHHTAGTDHQITESSELATLGAIYQQHRTANGWPGIGYHAVVFPSGRLYLTGLTTDIRYHAVQANPYSFGLAVSGNFMGKQPTGAALDTMRDFIANMRLGFKRDFGVLGHKDVVQTSCPGDRWAEWKPLIVGEVPDPDYQELDWQTVINVTRGWGRELAEMPDALTLRQALERLQEAGKQLTDVAAILERLRSRGAKQEEKEGR